jgi:two-component system, cell cycle sensor histidine kinase and response regulator CckA
MENNKNASWFSDDGIRFAELNPVDASHDERSLAGAPGTASFSNSSGALQPGNVPLQSAPKHFWLSIALDSAADGIVIVDPEGRVQYLNPAAQRITGFLPEQAFGKHFRSVLVLEYHGAIVKDDLLRLATLNEEPLSLGQDLILVSAGGDRYQIEAEICAGNKNSGAFGAAVITLRDVTRRKWEENQHRQEHAIRAVERLAGTTAHALNDILTTILGRAELLLNDAALTTEQRENLLPILTAAGEASTVVRQLSAVSRTRFTARYDLDINEVLQKMLPNLSAAIPSRISVSLQLGSDIGKISADRDQLEHIVFNLVLNAADAIAAAGQITISTQSVQLDEVARGRIQQSFALVTIADTGEGMSKETMECIFEPFFTLRKDGAHSGLGLSITQGMVRDYKGFMEVESTLGAGTTVRVGLPCIEPDPFAYLDVSAAEAERLGAKTILLVDDDRAVRQLLRKLLEKGDYMVIEAPDGEEALLVARLHDKHIDLLITDIGMPGISGTDLVLQFAPLHPESKFLLISGFSSSVLEISDGRLPAVDFLQKPFSQKDLMTRIHDLLGA